MYIKCLYVKKAIPHFVLICFLQTFAYQVYPIPNEKGVKLRERGGKWTDKDGSVFFHFSKAINIWKYENNVKVVTKGQCNAHFLSDHFWRYCMPFLFLYYVAAMINQIQDVPENLVFFESYFGFSKPFPHNKAFKKYIKKTSH